MTDTPLWLKEAIEAMDGEIIANLRVAAAELGIRLDLHDYAYPKVHLCGDHAEVVCHVDGVPEIHYMISIGPDSKGPKARPTVANFKRTLKQLRRHTLNACAESLGVRITIRRPAPKRRKARK